MSRGASRTGLLVLCPRVLLHEVNKAVRMQPAWTGKVFRNGLPHSGRKVCAEAEKLVDGVGLF